MISACAASGSVHDGNDNDGRVTRVGRFSSEVARPKTLKFRQGRALRQRVHVLGVSVLCKVFIVGGWHCIFDLAEEIWLLYKIKQKSVLYQNCPVFRTMDQLCTQLTQRKKTRSGVFGSDVARPLLYMYPPRPPSGRQRTLEPKFPSAAAGNGAPFILMGELRKTICLRQHSFQNPTLRQLKLNSRTKYNS